MLQRLGFSAEEEAFYTALLRFPARPEAAVARSRHDRGGSEPRPGPQP
jgi:hypothetical protein